MRFSRPLFILSLFLVSCSHSFIVSKHDTKEYVFSDSTQSVIDSSIDQEIAPFRQKVKAEMSTVLATSTTTLERGNPESKLGDFVADACFIQVQKIENGKFKPDFAVFNSGGLRRPLPKGDITRGDIFELMPFENELVVVTLTGDRIEKLINFIASKGGAPVSGLRMKIDGVKGVDVFINRQAFDSTKTYQVLTSDYLANGGDSFDFFLDAPKENTLLKVRDALIGYLEDQTRSGKKIDIQLDQRTENAR